MLHSRIAPYKISCFIFITCFHKSHFLYYHTYYGEITDLRNVLNLQSDSFSKLKKKKINHDFKYFQYSTLCLRTTLACKLLFILQYIYQSIANLSLQHYSTLYWGWNQSTTTDGNSKELQDIPQLSSKSPLARLLDLILANTYVNFKTVMTQLSLQTGDKNASLVKIQ